MQATAARESPVSRAIFQKGWRVLRRVSTLSVCSVGIRVRGRCGRLVRPWRPAKPSFSKRINHLETVTVETPTALAIAHGVSPAGPRSTIIFGVVLAFLTGKRQTTAPPLEDRIRMGSRAAIDRDTLAVIAGLSETPGEY
jgi:hypothetical protein